MFSTTELSLSQKTAGGLAMQTQTTRISFDSVKLIPIITDRRRREEVTFSGRGRIRLISSLPGLKALQVNPKLMRCSTNTHTLAQVMKRGEPIHRQGQSSTHHFVPHHFQQHNGQKVPHCIRTRVCECGALTSRQGNCVYSVRTAAHIHTHTHRDINMWEPVFTS